MIHQFIDDLFNVFYIKNGKEKLAKIQKYMENRYIPLLEWLNEGW
jgi:hypothetical protein